MPVTRTAVWTPFMYVVSLPSTTAAVSWGGIASETGATPIATELPGQGRQTVLVGGVHRWGRGTTPVMP